MAGDGAKSYGESLLALVRGELDRVLAGLGLATADDLARVTERLDRLERSVARATAPRTAKPAKPAKPAGSATAAKPRTRRPTKRSGTP